MSFNLGVNLAANASASAKPLASGTDADAGSPLGLFAAVLDSLGLSTEASATAETSDAVATTTDITTTSGSSETTLVANFGDLLGGDLTVDGSADADATDIDTNPGDLISDLATALAAVRIAVEQDRPIPPGLEAKLNATLDALSGLLGIDLKIDTGTPAQQLQDAPEAALVAGASVNKGESFGDILSATVGVGAGVPAAGDADDAAAPTTPSASTSTDAEVSTNALADLKTLADKLAELGKALEGKSDVAARKLEALAQKLGSGDVSAEVLAKLGVDPATPQKDPAVAALLAVKAEVKPVDLKPAEVVQNLAAAGAIKQPETAPAKDTTPAPDTRPEPQPRPADELDTAIDVRKADLRISTHLTASADTRPATADVKTPAQISAVAAPIVTVKEANADPTQPSATGTPGIRTDFAVGAKAVHAAYQAPPVHINLPQLAFEIARHASDGQNRFHIRLDPAELGRIDVKLDMDGSGNLNARLTVERAETLDLLQRDQKSLEKALAQAGLDSSKTNLEFSLKQNPFSTPGGNGRTPFDFGTGVAANAEAEVETVPVNVYRGTATAGGVNLFV